MRDTELLIPAGSLDVLKTAVIYGADAVYLGGEAFGLRAKAKNFTNEEIKEGIAFAHERGVKVYDTYVESLFPTQGAGGFSLSFLRMDDSYRPYYDRRAESPLFYKKEIRHGRND